ncbi:hypothetical protein FRZ00_26335 [Streptomyces mobaraensis]|uniref:Uncharacterized protein n=2 Tax=Streptomyces mobaraensis TaxID=35621 RepID=A0A5N5W352_STRMB|nr:hypothetical protein FRZ00_26335 [Streptomyces mobaraensis]
MTRTEVAEYLDIAPNSVRAQMAKWEIEAVEYRRGPNGRPEACYPTAAVQASAARRPGQGHRSDLT